MNRLVTNICLGAVVLMVLALGALHYYKIGSIPYGFHVDEMSGAVTMGCLASEGTDAHRVPYPVFADLNYGTPKPPTYLYPALLWTKIFGWSVASLRAFSVTGHLFGVIGIFFLARALFGFRYALLTLLAASISPWVWVSSRVAFESLFAATFIIWGLYFFLKSTGGWRMALAGLCFALAMYSYPPIRLQMPLMLLSLLFYGWIKGLLDLKKLGILIAAVGLPLIPLAQRIFSGELQGRFNMISIFSTDYLNSLGKTNSLKDLAEIFTNNYLLHLQPDFLFKVGDPSLVHSTGHHGILSWLDVAALALMALFMLFACIKKYRLTVSQAGEQYFIVFLVVNIAIGIVPAALTNSELPNALRISGSWPFMCLLTGFFLWKACERYWALWLAVVLTAGIFANSLLRVYFFKYPKESKGMFNFWTLDQANALKTDEEWFAFIVRYRNDDYHARYFLMQYKKMGCSESKSVWDNIRTAAQQQGIK